MKHTVVLLGLALTCGAELLFAVAMPRESSRAEPLRKLAAKLEKGLSGQANKKIAVLSFPYHDGTTSSGSTIVQERMTTFLVEGGKIDVIERNLLKKVMEELKLGMTGLIDPKTSMELGRILGVGAIVTGTLNDVSSDMTEVNARVIEAETGKILAAGQAEIERTWKDSPAAPQPPAIPPAGFLGKPLIQIALLLDTSNSMDGLINQAKTQLWKIVNELSASEKGGNNPSIQVALYEYGNDNLKSEDGYTRQVLPLTTDLDKISEQLFALATRGGQEYCGYAINNALEKLKWDSHADVYKAVFIAGNEPFTQGPVDFRLAAELAAKKGIFLNTVFCGNRQEGIATQWKAAADLAQGDYTSIDQSAPAAAMETPQDGEIARLGMELNKTYVAYGKGASEYARRQSLADSKAVSAGAGIMAARAVTKASRQYAETASWDLIGALENKTLKEEDIKKEELPEEMRSMNETQRKAHIRRKAEERRLLQKKISELNSQRQKYIEEQEKKRAGAATLDKAIINSVRAQAGQKGFSFRK